MTQSVRYTITFWVVYSINFISYSAFSQNSPLDKIISVRFNDERLDNVLEYIAKQGDFNFSYNSSLIDPSRKIDLLLYNKPIREVLSVLFKGTIRYKLQGQYVILIKNETPPKTTIYISGFVIDANTGEKLPNVSIYEKNSLAAAISNANGYYKLKLSSPKLPFKLTVSKPGFVQQSVWIKTAQSDTKDWILQAIEPVGPLKLPIDDNTVLFPNTIDSAMLPTQHIVLPTVPNTEISLNEYIPDVTNEGIFPVYRKIDTARKANLWEQLKERFGKMMVHRSQRIHAQNVTDTLYRSWQISLLPFLGTNRLLSGSIENGVSINIVMGYSAGVRKFEFGGLFNGVRRNMNGIQVAGVGNIVGKDVKGMQFAGVFNTNLGQTEGMSLAGVWNHSWRNHKGVQMATLINLTHKSLRGVQMSALLNVSGSISKGVQLSPNLNVVLKESRGWQIGFINFAHKVSKGGKQFGFLNFSDSSATTPIGFLSFVGRGNGYKRLEAAIDENQSANFTFKTGVPAFYNIITLGYNFVRTYETFNIGYGVGRAYKLGRRWMLNTDLVTNAIVEYDGMSGINQGTLFRLDIGFEKFLARNSTLTFGPSVKALIIDPQNSSYWNGKPFRNMPTYQAIRSTEKFTLWIGFQMGMRIKQRYGD